MSTLASMDRRIERQRFTPGRIALFAGVALAFGTALLLIAMRSGTTSLRMEPTRLTTAKVGKGEFRDYYPVDGRVEPANTVYLDIEQGGRVEEIHVKGGHPIARGELIMRLSNANLHRSA